METFNKYKGQNILKLRIILAIVVIFFFFYFVLRNHVSSFIDKFLIHKEFAITTPTTPTRTNSSNSQKIPGIDSETIVDDGIKMLYKTKENGRIWYSKWNGRSQVPLISGQVDPLDKEFISRGNGVVIINGTGHVRLQGESPRMYVYDQFKNKKWDSVEVTIYSKRFSESENVSSQGIVIGARSEHQDVTLQNPCLGATYYGRLLYDGRAVFQKELAHGFFYTSNKPSENNNVKWDTQDGTMPLNVWIGMKFVVKTNSDGKSVKLELYRDLTDGKNGGTWERVAEYVDDGSWISSSSKSDLDKICGYSSNKVLLDPGTSVFIRNDNVIDVEYKLFSIREI